MPGAWLIVLAFGQAVLVGLCDFLTGPDLFFTQFYLVPIAFAAWYGGFATSFATAILCLVVWSSVSVWEHAESYSHVYEHAWNALSHLAIFLPVVYLLARLRKALAAERELACKDPLTGAFNRRLFYLMAEREIERARRTGRSFTVAYFDIDGFKEVNDQLGHVHGDRLLNLVVETVARNIRGTDLFARLGGDEFAILQPDTDRDRARSDLSDLREVLCSESAANGFPVACSMGVVTFDKPPANIEAMIHRADELMYRVKSAGKNAIRYEVVGFDG